MNTEQNNSIPYIPPCIYVEVIRTRNVIATSGYPYPKEEDLY